jgi:HAE1 family hydrophobic/amphiphilic exporter-1
LHLLQDCFLWFLQLVGAIGNRTIGSASAGGMLIGTVFGLFVIPGLYYIFATIAEKYKFVKEEEENPLTEDFTNE